MSNYLVAALVIPWVFWGALAGLLIYAGRSWINMLVIPVGISAVLLVAAHFTSAREAFWASSILHLVFLVYFLGSYLFFVRKGGGAPD